MADFIDYAVDAVTDAATQTQVECSKTLAAMLLSLDTASGRLVPDQDYGNRVLKLEKQLRQIAAKGMRESIAAYMGSFTTIQDRNVALQRTYGAIEVEASKLLPARKFVLEQATNYLSEAGIARQFIQPAKYLLMQQVVTGASITEAQKMLERWAAGELTDGKRTAGRPTPNLQRYATQLARDTVYQYNGTIQDIIRKEYGLTHFIYAGGVVGDSRPLCRRLVGSDDSIAFADLPALLNAYPQGIIPGTTAQNFQVYRGGYNCQHICYPVKAPEVTK